MRLERCEGYIDALKDIKSIVDKKTIQDIDNLSIMLLGMIHRFEYELNEIYSGSSEDITKYEDRRGI